MTAADFADSDLTRNDFLGGKLHIHQPAHGYRAGVDPVLLAASILARPGQSVLELGCGAGVAALCLGARVPGLEMSGLELQPGYAALARRNGDENNMPLKVEEGDLARMPASLRARRFDHVMANPPYFDRAHSTAATDKGREVAMGEGTPLKAWVEQAARRCAPGGSVTFIQRAARAPELLSMMAQHLGSLEILPLIPRRGRDARLILLRGRKGGRAEFRLHDGWVLHDGAAHDGDRESYSAATAEVLRNGAPLPFPA